MKREFIVEREGKRFVLYAGLLDEAHEQGLKSITTQLLQIPADANGYTAICTAVVETEKGRFCGIGDASPDNVTRIMRQHLIRMAETRAKARALRDAVNVGVAALEELGEKTAEGVSGEDPAYYDPWAEERQPDTAGKQPPAPGRTRTNGRTAVVNGQEAASAQGRALGQGADQATPAQVNAVYAICRREYKWSEGDTDAHCRAQYGKPVGELSKRQCSEWIDKLKTGQVPAA